MTYFYRTGGRGHGPLAPLDPERSQNTILLASTQAVYKAPHSTVRGDTHVDTQRRTHTELQLAACSGSSRKSQSVRLEHDTLGSVVTSCTYASAINASKISSVFIVYRRKTLTGSPDPMHATVQIKPCNPLLTLPFSWQIL